MQDPFCDEVRRALSDERLEKYRYRRDRESGDYAPPLTRYCWNVALCASLYPVLHVLEVTLRNALYDAIAKRYPPTSRPAVDAPCWLDFQRPILYREEWQKVQEVKDKLIEKGRRIIPGRIVAGLDFGFWVGLMHGEYENRRRRDCPDIWPQIIPDAFPHRPAGMDTREPFFKRFHAIKELRNRVFHHEPIWNRPRLFSEHRMILQAINWMNQSVAEEMEALSPFPVVCQNQVAPFVPPIAKAQASRRPVPPDLAAPPATGSAPLVTAQDPTPEESGLRRSPPSPTTEA